MEQSLRCLGVVQGKDGEVSDWVGLVLKIGVDLKKILDHLSGNIKS